MDYDPLYNFYLEQAQFGYLPADDGNQSPNNGQHPNRRPDAPTEIDPQLLHLSSSSQQQYCGQHQSHTAPTRNQHSFNPFQQNQYPPPFQVAPPQSGSGSAQDPDPIARASLALTATFAAPLNLLGQPTRQTVQRPTHYYPVQATVDPRVVHHPNWQNSYRPREQHPLLITQSDRVQRPRSEAQNLGVQQPGRENPGHFFPQNQQFLERPARSSPEDWSPRNTQTGSGLRGAESIGVQNVSKEAEPLVEDSASQISMGRVPKAPTLKNHTSQRSTNAFETQRKLELTRPNGPPQTVPQSWDRYRQAETSQPHVLQIIQPSYIHAPILYPKSIAPAPPAPTPNTTHHSAYASLLESTKRGSKGPLVFCCLDFPNVFSTPSTPSLAKHRVFAFQQFIEWAKRQSELRPLSPAEIQGPGRRPVKWAPFAFQLHDHRIGRIKAYFIPQPIVSKSTQKAANKLEFGRIDEDTFEGSFNGCVADSSWDLSCKRLSCQARSGVKSQFTLKMFSAMYSIGDDEIVDARKTSLSKMRVGLGHLYSTQELLMALDMNGGNADEAMAFVRGMNARV